MVDQNQRRENGKTAGEELAEEASKNFEEPVNPELPDERRIRWRTPGLSRMRVSWSGEDRAVVALVTETVNKRLQDTFGSAYDVLGALYDVVRDYVTDAAGEPVLDDMGVPKWRLNAHGDYAEDWTRLTGRQRERFLFQITTRLFEWEQLAADAWGEAMMSKARWEEEFAAGYEALEGKGATVDARNAHGNLHSMEEKYFAIYCTWYSRKAEGLVRTMQLLNQRLKDVHSA